MKNKFLLLLTLLLFTGGAQAQTSKQLMSLDFVDAPLEQAVELYRSWTGRTIIKQADLSAQITLKGRQLTQEEAKQAIETVLAMNGVALVPMGDKFLKVVPIATARQEGMSIQGFDPDKKYTQADQLISQVIPLRYVIFTDVQPLIQHLIHSYGQVQYLERINSVLITDTSSNISRLVEVLEMVDQPVEKIKPRIYQLKYAEASSVASKLKELVDAAKTEKSEQTVVSNVRAPAGVIRAMRGVPAPSSSSSPQGSLADETEMIQGEVKFVSDERTNIMIVFSKAANFDFFDRIIKVLDVPVDPAVVVETINLEYAEAKDIASILNDFVGAAKETEKTKTGGDATDKSPSPEPPSDIVRSIGRAVSASAQSAIGRLSEDTKILSDERTNSLLLMGRKSDVEALKIIIGKLDVMLQQVVIEAIILNVGLGDSFSTGVQWVYENGMSDELSSEQSFGTELSASITNSLDTVTDYTFGYYKTFPSLNLSAVISAAKSDSDSRVLSTPVVMTTDNTEAKITVADEQPVVTSSTSYSSSTATSSATYEYKTIGVELTVTPHINPANFVLMEITQSADDIGDYTSIDGNDVPTIQAREITATVGVKDRDTVVLGGLVRKAKSESSTKIPLLGDIPLLGWFFSSHTTSDDRDELVVLLTPYVLNNPAESSSEAQRRFKSSDASTTEWPRGWSESPLSNDEPESAAEPDEKKKDEKRFKTLEEAVESL